MSNSIKLTRTGNIHVAMQEAFVSETHRRVAELLQEYDPYLELHWIPPGSRGQYDVAPWAVVHNPPHMDAYTVFYTEDADERLLARVIQADNANKNVLTEMEARNKAHEALRLHQERENRQESHALAAAVLRSNKFHYKHGGVDFGNEPGRR
jgi:hypothetical protein